MTLYSFIVSVMQSGRVSLTLLESGAGSHGRRKDIISTPLSSEATFEAIMRVFKERFQALVVHTQREAQVSVQAHLDVLKVTFDMLRNENVALESERDSIFRNRVANSVTSVQAGIKRIQATIASFQPTSEMNGERRAMLAFAKDFPFGFHRIPTPSNGRRCAWEALTRSWSDLRRQIEFRSGVLLGEITTNELDDIYAGLVNGNNQEFDMGNTSMFRADQMGLVITSLVQQRFGIDVQLGYIHPYRGQRAFPVLTPHPREPDYRLWVYNNNLDEAEWDAAHFEGIERCESEEGENEDADNSRI